MSFCTPLCSGPEIKMSKPSLKNTVNYYVEVCIFRSIENPAWRIIRTEPGHPAANYIKNSLQDLVGVSVEDSVKECAEELVWEFVDSEIKTHSLWNRSKK